MKFLSRDEFRRKVFERDQHTCVFCSDPVVDAHHIIERRLWKDGGYYVDNGASVCAYHHYECEQTSISVEEVREACKITNIILPEHLYDDQRYDKWGNIILPNGTRLKGELFYDQSVQKVLAPFLHLFVDWIKYPRTYHLPWSQNCTDDDRMLDNVSNFVGKSVIVTEKMDGENTTMYLDYLHARSTEYKSHDSRDWLKQYASKFSFNIPKGWRVCGENLYAVHSIVYANLHNYFMAFSIWNEENVCLSWKETVEWLNLLEIPCVPVLYNGIFDESKIKTLYNKSDWENREGYVIRTADSFPYSKFRENVAKFVRSNHVKTTKHWFRGQKMIKNKIG